MVIYPGPLDQLDLVCVGGTVQKNDFLAQSTY